MTDLCRCLKRERIPFFCDFPLEKHNTLHIACFASLAVFPETRDQLVRALEIVTESGVAFAVVGKGSNLLFPDGLYRGAIVFTEHCSELICRENEMTASAGTPLVTVALRASERGLTGAEFAAGIPGTVGGAVLMNAGAFGGSMEQIAVRSEYWDRTTKSRGFLEGSAQGFGTRTSVYARDPRYVILSAELRFAEGDRAEIKDRMETYRRRRAETQPLRFPNAGSIFKHPEGQYAGKLIEECGLKGTRIGGAEVSELHAGFIINRGSATARDVKALIAFIRYTVCQKTGITLECELRSLDGKAL